MSGPATHVVTRPPSSLAKFPELPPEIREPIWRHVASHERVVGIREEEDKDHFCSDALVPAMLHVNSEARGIGLTLYIIKLGTPDDFDQTYINPLADAVVVGDMRTFRHLLDINDIREKITRLVVDDIITFPRRLSITHIARFVSLKELYLVKKEKCWKMPIMPFFVKYWGGFSESQEFGDHTWSRYQNAAVVRSKSLNDCLGYGGLYAHLHMQAFRDMVESSLSKHRVVEIQRSGRYRRKTIVEKGLELRRLFQDAWAKRPPPPPPPMVVKTSCKLRRRYRR